MINVMTYDLYGSWHNKIGHHSALFHRTGETGMERELNTVCLIEESFFPFIFYNLYFRIIQCIIGLKQVVPEIVLI
jgi:hypothetical protein